MTRPEPREPAGPGAWQRLAMRLAARRIGRIALHCGAALRDGEWRWHLSGVARELARPFGPAHPVATRMTTGARPPSPLAS